MIGWLPAVLVDLAVMCVLTLCRTFSNEPSFMASGKIKIKGFVILAK